MAGPDTNPAVMVDDSAKWAALAKEMETPDPILDAPPERTPGEPLPPPRSPSPPLQRHEDIRAPQPDPEPEPQPDDQQSEPRPRLTYEQLETNNRNTTEALRQAREQAKRAEESLQAVHRMVEDMRATRAQQQPRAEPQPEFKIPDVNDDPIGHFSARQQYMEEQLRQALQGNQYLNDQQVAQQRERQFWQHVENAENQFRPTTPVVEIDGKKISDYDLACEHLRNHRLTELEGMYPDNSQVAMAEARQLGLPSVAHLRQYLMHQDAMNIASRAFTLGVSPGALYYQAAKGRGYVTPTAAAAKPNGKNEKIAAAQRGQKAALTISGGESRRAPNEMSLTDLSDLWLEDPDEFDKQWEVMKRAGKL